MIHQYGSPHFPILRLRIPCREQAPLFLSRKIDGFKRNSQIVAVPLANHQKSIVRIRS